MSGKKTKWNQYQMISVLSFLGFIMVWSLCAYFDVKPDYALPSPLKVARTFMEKMYQKAPDRGYIWYYALVSLRTVFVGWIMGIVIGVPLGIIMGWYKRMDQFFKPVFDVIRPIPPIGWFPVFLVVFGIGVTSQVIVIFLASFVPCVINSYSGIKGTKQVHLWVAKTFGASDLDMLFRVAIPSAAPMIFTGIKVGLNAAWMSIVTAEMMASTSGIGYMIYICRSLGRADIVIVGMLVIGAISAVFTGVLGRVKKRLVRGR